MSEKDSNLMIVLKTIRSIFLVFVGIIAAQLPILAITIYSISDATATIVGQLIIVLMMVLAVAITYAIFRYSKSTRPNDIGPEEKLEVKDIGYVLVSYAAILGVNILISIVSSYFISAPDTANQDALNDLMAGPYIYLMLVAVVFIAPLCEEFTIRGCMSNWFFTKNKYLSILLSSALFSYLHASDTIFGFLTYFSMGAIIGLAFFRKRNIKLPIALHFLNNLVAGVTMFLLFM